MRCPECGNKSIKLETWSPKPVERNTKTHWHIRQCVECNHKFGVRKIIMTQTVDYHQISRMQNYCGNEEKSIAGYWL